MMEHYLEQLDLTELMQQLDGLFPAFSLDFQGMLDRILAGRWKDAFFLLKEEISAGILAEVNGMKGLMAAILIMGMLSVLISGFMTGFENKQIAEIAHTCFYLLLLSVLLRIFSGCYESAKKLLETITQFSRLVLPALCLSVGPAQGAATAAGYYELAVFFIFLVESFLLRLCLPCLPVYMLLLLMNGVWEEQKLTHLMDLLEKALRAADKFCLAAVTGLGFLQAMVAPALDSVKRGLAQKAVSAIPGLGSLAEGSVELLIGSAVLVKNGLGVFFLLLLTALVAGPILKLFLYGSMLKISGALVGVAADKRLTACILQTANAIFLTLRLLACSTACFFILTAIVAFLTGKG